MTPAWKAAEETLMNWQNAVREIAERALEPRP